MIIAFSVCDLCEDMETCIILDKNQGGQKVCDYCIRHLVRKCLREKQEKEEKLKKERKLL